MFKSQTDNPDSPTPDDITPQTKYGEGFSIVEPLKAISIIGILAAIANYCYHVYREKVMVARTIAALRVISTEVQAAFIRDNKQPDSLADIKLGNLRDEPSLEGILRLAHQQNISWRTMSTLPPLDVYDFQFKR